MSRLEHELRLCGLNGMADRAHVGEYEKEPGKLVIDLRYALTLKSLSMREVGMIGRLHKRAADGEFNKGE